MLSAALRKVFGRRPSVRRSGPERPSCRPQLELLESRLVPSTLNVGGGRNPYPTLAAALAAAHSGDTIRVHGTVRVSTSNLSVTQNDLKLTGADDESTIEATGSFSGPILAVTGADVRISGLTIDDDRSTSDAGLQVTGSATIDHDVLKGSGTGVLVSGAGLARVQNDVLAGDMVGVEVLNGTADTVVSNNLFKGDGTGVLLAGATSNVQVLDNDFAGAAMNYGVQITAGAAGNLVRNNDIDHAAVNGVSVTGASGDNSSTAGNTIQNNEIAGAGQDGIYLNGSWNAVIEHNEIVGSGGAGVHLVNSFLAQVSHDDVEFNAADGIFIEGGGFHTVDHVFSAGNQRDGVHLSNNTVNNLLQADLFVFNGRNGVSLFSAQNTTIQDSRIFENEAGGVFIDPNSTGTVLQNNHIQTGPDPRAAHDRDPIGDDLRHGPRGADD